MGKVMTLSFNFDDDRQLFATMACAGTLQPIQRYWLYHAIMGGITVDLLEFDRRVKRYQAADPAGFQGLAGNPGSLLSDVVVGMNFVSANKQMIADATRGHPLDQLKPEILDVLARTSLLDGEYEKAIECYDEIEKRLGPDSLAYTYRAAIHYARGKIEKADKDYARFIKRLEFIFAADGMPFDQSTLYNSYKQATEELDDAIKNRRMSFKNNEKYWGNKTQVVGNWKTYYRAFRSAQRLNGERTVSTGWAVNHHLSEVAAATLAEDKRILAAMNFGSFCGYADLLRANAHPGCHWLGYDRESLAISLNRKEFKAKNLSFADGEFEDALAGLDAVADGGKRLICHARSFTEMAPALVESVYRKAGKAGVEWIVGAEFAGPNLVRRKYFDDRKKRCPSQMLTLQTITHDYRGMLAKAGYEVVDMTDWPVIAYHNLPDTFPVAAIVAGAVYRTYRARLK